MTEFCTFELDGAACVFGDGHRVQYHHLDNGMNVPIGDAVAPPSSSVVALDDFLDKVAEQRSATERGPGVNNLDSRAGA